jgi:hypothetical protein
VQEFGAKFAPMWIDDKNGYFGRINRHDVMPKFAMWHHVMMCASVVVGNKTYELDRLCEPVSMPTT